MRKLTSKATAAQIVLGDALSVLDHVGEGTCDLAYLDPPFAVGKPFGARTHESGERARGVIAYDDRWPSLDTYLAWLRDRLVVVRDTLSPEGSLWLHLDHRAIHEAKVLGDSVFGRASFQGEIIWVPGNGSKARNRPSATHQTILIFAKRTRAIWNRHDPLLREPYAKTSEAMHFTNEDNDGRVFRERVVAGKTYRYYLDEGRALGSVWTDCPAMVANTPLRKETTGYPTQKPLSLLRRIVRAASREGSLVVDPFSGSGTTLVAAVEGGRRAFGMDVSPLAVSITKSRLAAASRLP